MASPANRPQVEFRGLRRRGGVRGAVLVLAGALPPELRRAVAQAGTLCDHSLLVAVDGGLDTCIATRRTPDLLVGDGDSASALPEKITTVRYATDKDFSDLAGALEELQSREVQVVTVAGLLGGRLDHEWANLLELARHARSFAGFLAPTDRGTVVVTANGCRMKTVRRRNVSLFALGSTATVSLAGTRWQLKRRRLTPGSRGLSNVSGSELDLTVHGGQVALVFPTPRRRRRPATT